MNLELNIMKIEDLNTIRNALQDFDDFWNYDVFKTELQNSNSTYLMAKQNDQIVGFGGIWRSIDDFHITNIATKKQVRNLGIASLILEALIEIAKKEQAMTVTLEVNEHNLPAISLYQKYHFQKVGIRKRYYHHKDNAIIMTLFFEK